MRKSLITRDEVIKHSQALPVFPIILNQILTTIADPDANLNVLVNYVKHDAVIASRVMSLANSVANKRQQPPTKDIKTAIYLIGLSSVREMAMIGSTSNYVKNLNLIGAPLTYWQHSVAVGVCSNELARHMNYSTETAEAALIAGLLHDIGKIWLLYFFKGEVETAHSQMDDKPIGMIEAEIIYFGIDHATIGSWLAEHWLQPKLISDAILYHHFPDKSLDNSLVPLVHVAEVLCNALDITGRNENRVSTTSTLAFTQLGLIWGHHSRPKFSDLFGRIEARCRYANAILNQQ